MIAKSAHTDQPNLLVDQGYQIQDLLLNKLKIYSIKSLLIFDFLVLFLFIIFYFKYDTQKKLVSSSQVSARNNKTISSDSLAKTKVAPVNSFGPPIRLIIPILDIDANIQHLGVTQEGEMEVPSNITDVGWLKLGYSPGEKGSAVIAGHFNGKNNEAGVFANLNKLKKGDKLFVKDNKDQSLTFVVQQSRLYEPGYADSIFSSDDKPRLNLITCDGDWDKTKKSYSKRLVILADIAQ